MNFTAATQDEQLTRQHVETREVYLMERDGQLVATVTLRDRTDSAGVRHIYINALAVRRDLQRQGLGSLLLEFAEGVARERSVFVLRLDTAKPASHLIDLYTRSGYRVRGHRHWKGKTYDSVIMEKTLSATSSSDRFRAGA
jgi:GNAT superfamily N-acetyltransferase